MERIDLLALVTAVSGMILTAEVSGFLMLNVQWEDYEKRTKAHLHCTRKWERTWYGMRPVPWTWAMLAVYALLFPALLLTLPVKWCGRAFSWGWCLIDRPICKEGHDGGD